MRDTNKYPDKYLGKYRRESLRLQRYDYTQPGGYYITICTHQRHHLFGEIVNGKMQLNQFGQIVRDEWLRTSQIRPNIHMDAFVVMPNHLHGVILINDVEIPPEDDILPDLVNHFGIRYWSATSRRGAPNDQPTHMNETAHQIWRQPIFEQFGKPTANSVPTIIRGFKSTVTKQINIIRQCTGNPVWQSNYYEHIVRHQNDLNRIRFYISNNPMKWHRDRNQG